MNFKSAAPDEGTATPDIPEEVDGEDPRGRSSPEVRKSVRKTLGVARKSRDTDTHPLSLWGKNSMESDDIAGEISAALATGEPPPPPVVPFLVDGIHILMHLPLWRSLSFHCYCDKLDECR